MSMAKIGKEWVTVDVVEVAEMEEGETVEDGAAGEDERLIMSLRFIFREDEVITNNLLLISY